MIVAIISLIVMIFSLVMLIINIISCCRLNKSIKAVEKEWEDFNNGNK